MWWKIKALTFLLAAGAVAFVVHSWFAARRDATELKTTLSAEKKVIDAASERENLRNRDLQSALAQIEALRKKTKSPQQAGSSYNNTCNYLCQLQPWRRMCRRY